MALVKYNNNSISAITTTAGMPSGAMTLIKEQTASSSATISFVNGTSDVVISSTYPIYKFVYINVHPSQQVGDGEEFLFNFSVDTGSNYNVTKTSTYFTAYHPENDGANTLAYGASGDLAQGTGFQQLAGDHDADNDSSTSGELWLFNPSDTTFVKHFLATNNYMHSNPASINAFAAGYGNTTSAVDAVQFKFSAGNIDAGTFKLYGIKDS